MDATPAGEAVGGRELGCAEFVRFRGGGAKPLRRESALKKQRGHTMRILAGGPWGLHLAFARTPPAFASPSDTHDAIG